VKFPGAGRSALVATVCLLTQSAAAAQPAGTGSTQGPSGSLSIGYDRLHIDGPVVHGDVTWFEDDVRLSGGGLNLELAFGFGELAAVFVRASGSRTNAERFDEAGLGHFDIGLRVYPPLPAGAIKPYAMVARTGRALIIDDPVVVDFPESGSNAEDVEAEFAGGGLSWGVGFHNFLRRDLALNVQLARTGGDFTRFDQRMSVDGDESEIEAASINERARTTRLSFGLAWFFLR
jgi:hypothetical protein